jgi:hypothetical protein
MHRRRFRVSSALARPVGSLIVRSPKVVYSDRDDGALLLDVSSGRRISLDAFGRALWTSLDDSPTLSELLVRLRDDGMPAERLAEDITPLLARWRAQGLIRWR